MFDTLIANANALTVLSSVVRSNNEHEQGTIIKSKYFLLFYPLLFLHEFMHVSN